MLLGEAHGLKLTKLCTSGIFHVVLLGRSCPQASDTRGGLGFDRLAELVSRRAGGRRGRDPAPSSPVAVFGLCGVPSRILYVGSGGYGCVVFLSSGDVCVRVILAPRKSLEVFPPPLLCKNLH